MGCCRLRMLTCGPPAIWRGCVGRHRHPAPQLLRHLYNPLRHDLGVNPEPYTLVCMLNSVWTLYGSCSVTIQYIYHLFCPHNLLTTADSGPRLQACRSLYSRLFSCSVQESTFTGDVQRPVHSVPRRQLAPQFLGI